MNTQLIQARLTQRVAWGRPLRPHGETAGVEGYGEIFGFVYDDQNGNLRRDAGEPGIAGIPLILEDGSKIISDEDGKYHFKLVPVGPHLLRGDFKKVPADFGIPVSLKRNISLSGGQKLRIDFPLQRAARITGRVAMDMNENGRYDFGETGPAGVIVVARSQRFGLLTTYTGPDGRFAFENVLSDHYDIFIDRASLPEWTEQIDIIQYGIVLKPQRWEADIHFLLRAVSRPVKRFFLE